MKRFLHSAFIGLRKYILVLILAITYFSQPTILKAQVNESYNDGQLRLRVWLHAVYSDANCSENIINGPTKFIYNKLKVRASNGSGYVPDLFPGPALNNFYNQDMRFRVKGKTNRFWRMNEIYLLNPFYPFRESTFPAANPLGFPGDVFMTAAQDERAPIAPALPRRPVGIENTATQGFLLYDKSFPAGRAPDRYEWQIQDMFESDADISGGESVMNLGGFGCKTTFGLPSYYEGKKDLLPYDPLMTLLIVDSMGVTGLLWGAGLGACIDLFGWQLDPLNIVNIIASLIGISDYDDSWGTKKTWNDDPAFFRGTSPNTLGYFTTKKVKATGNTDGAGEGYILVFAHQWEWTGPDSGFEEAIPNSVKIQRELCDQQKYTDAPINLQVYLDGYFTDVDHEGSDLPLIGGLLGCTDIGIGPSALTGNEEKYIRARASTQFTGMPAWNPTIKSSQDNPDWINTNQLLLNYTYTESGMNTFNYELESWESDCLTDFPKNCNVCLFGGDANDDCCNTRAPSWLGGFCVLPPWPTNELSKISASDFDHHASTYGTVNWRNSPPNTNNYVYVPIQLSTGRFDSHLARLRYIWSIPKPKAGTVDGVREVLLCPGETHTMSTTGYKNATWFQWQYAEVNTLDCPPSNAKWINIPKAQGGICPQNYTTSAFTGTRAYRMLVYNRAGDGSKSPNGDKFAYDSTVCTIISMIDSIQVPIDGPIACGTQSKPTTVRAGSAITLRPVLPPSKGSTDIPGIVYEWSSVGGSVSPTNPVSSPWETTLSFPTTSPTLVSVTLLTNVHPKCPLNKNFDTTCYYQTEDPGCSGTTGVIYVSHLAGPGGIGTINKPYNLSDGFATSNGDPNIKHVKILAGNYLIDTSTTWAAMKLKENLVVEGNYVERYDATLGENVWIKQSDTVTNIVSNIIENVSGVTHTIGFKSTGNNWILQDINITTGNSPDRDDLIYKFGSGRGLSNYAIHIDNSTGWKMINVTAKAGQAGKGSKGLARTETCDDATTPPRQEANSPASTGGIGNNNYCGSRSGGDGGDKSTPGGTAFYSSSPCPAAGCGGAVGQPGQPGRTGSNGTSINGVIASDLSSWFFYIPKPSTLASGTDGGGGGGGGGSASWKGAAGGLGGLGGSSGFGSGAAFGIWVSGGSNGLVTNFAPSVLFNIAQVGGDGGDGMDGYPGGIAPVGTGAGGQGGKGGQGGQGATGGVAGFNLGSYIQPGSTMKDTTPSYGIPRIESDYASGCTNSKIVIRRYGSPDWSGYTGALDYPDIAPAKTTYPNGTDLVKYIYYPTGSLGPKMLEAGANKYQNQIYIRYERPMPTISVPTRICYNTPIDLISTPGMADPIDHEWVIQKNIPLPNAPYSNPVPVYQIQGVANPKGVILPNSTNDTISYQVRYRVRDNCCGWSVPIYSTIVVLPQINNVIGFKSDTTIICNAGDPSVIITNPTKPVPTGTGWIYQWFQSFNGGPFDSIIGATAETYDPPVLSSIGTYQFIRVIGSTNAFCGDTSNIITIIVTENFKDNNIAYPVPFTAECVPPRNAPDYNSGTVDATNVNIGFMNGSAPTGPGTPSTFYYQWQRSVDTTNWVNVDPLWPSTGGTKPEGTGSAAQSWDPGTQVPPVSFSYGNSVSIFPQGALAGLSGHVQFRRIVQRIPGDFVCADTSNFVVSEIIPGRRQWNNCPVVTSGPNQNNTAASCKGNFPPESALYGYQGTCAIQSPDTICPGLVDLKLPTINISNGKLAGDQFIWYSQVGGPYNSDLPNIPIPPYTPQNSCAPATANLCTNPMQTAGCKNNKGTKATFVTFAPYDTSGTTLSVLIDKTTTFYVNAVDRCFDTTAFKTSANPENMVNRWQRKTVVVIIPFTYLDSLSTPDSILCDGVTPPDSITLTIYGGNLGNDGHFVIYDTDPTVGGPHTPIYEAEKRDSSASARNYTLLRPTVTTTYYARMENRCDTSQMVSKTITFVEPSVAPDSLTGPDLACDESITLTVNGGSLGDGAEWVLYDGDPLTTGAPITSNITGIFNVTPSANTTYYVRAESDAPCPETDAVSKFVTYSDTCVCEGIIEYAVVDSTTIAAIPCETTDGWTYYAAASKPNVFLFAIQHTPGTAPGGGPGEATGNTVPFNATCSITVTANPTSVSDVFYSEDLLECEANFVMPRYWNVSFVGPKPTLNGFVRIRFFFPEAELDATLAAATAWRNIHHMSTCGLPLTVGPTQVFKTTDGTPFEPIALSGSVDLFHPLTDILPTTINDFRYVGYLMSTLPHGDTYAQVMMGKNYVQVGWENFSGGGVAIRVSPDIIVLPITLLHFTGTLVEDQVYLDWETASELNNDYFIVEKSADAINWTNIGSVKGNGTTNTPHKYQLIDGQPFNGKNYYRLRQVDFDGTKAYSRVIVIDVNNTKTFDNSFTVLPNPTSGPVVATIVSNIDQNVNMRILDISGRLMGNTDISLAKGVNQLKLDLTKYPAATYILSYTDKSGQEMNAKVVKQ